MVFPVSMTIIVLKLKLNHVLGEGETFSQLVYSRSCWKLIFLPLVFPAVFSVGTKVTGTMAKTAMSHTMFIPAIGVLVWGSCSENSK